jgi:3-hydroxyisobutyrate dehydrogenase-like beta-hydroxyacid dehydrogenase
MILVEGKVRAMAGVAFLGTGLLGSGMVEGMLRRGERVTVWNRTAAKARALERFGAKVAATPGEAVQGAGRIHLTLSDDASVDDLLARILLEIPSDAIVIDHTTTSPIATASRYARMAEHGVDFLHAPVFMSPDMARNAIGLLMTSSSERIYQRAQEALRTMTADVWYLGDNPSRAAAYKLFGNSMIFVMTAGLADVFAMARNLDIATTDAIEVFSRFQTGGVIKYRGDKMARGDFSASFELTMARKDIRLMLEAAGQEPLVVLPSIARRMDQAIERGYGQEDLGALAHT